MQVDRINTPAEERASGLTAPLIRTASHIGYILGYLDEMTDEHFDENKESILGDMGRELNEAISHLRDDRASGDNPFVSVLITQYITALRVSLDGMRAATYDSKADLIRDLQNQNHNTAYIGARMDQDTAGIEGASEGLFT